MHPDGQQLERGVCQTGTTTGELQRVRVVFDKRIVLQCCEDRISHGRHRNGCRPLRGMSEPVFPALKDFTRNGRTPQQLPRCLDDRRAALGREAVAPGIRGPRVEQHEWLMPLGQQARRESRLTVAYPLQYEEHPGRECGVRDNQVGTAGPDPELSHAPPSLQVDPSEGNVALQLRWRSVSMGPRRFLRNSAARGPRSQAMNTPQTTRVR